MTPSPFLRDRLPAFLDGFDLSPADYESLASNVVRSVLHTKPRIGLEVRRKCKDLGIVSEYSHFKHQYLDVSAHLNKDLWRAAVQKIQEGKAFPNDIEKDLEFCFAHLDDTDLQVLSSKSENAELNVDHISLDTWTTGQNTRRDLLSYAKSKSHTLKFLTDFDPGLDMEDLTQELLCEVVRIYNLYQRSKGKSLEKEIDTPLRTKLEKYIEVSLNHKVTYLKSYYTRANRRRVCSTNEQFYRDKCNVKAKVNKNPECRKLRAEIEKLRATLGTAQTATEKANLKARLNKAEQKYAEHEWVQELARVEEVIKNAEGDYYSTVTSFYRETSEGVTNLEEQIPDERDYESHLVVEDLIRDLGDPYQKLLRVLRGQNSEYERWYANNEIPNTLEHQKAAAIRYLKISGFQLARYIQKTKEVDPDDSAYILAVLTAKDIKLRISVTPLFLDLDARISRFIEVVTANEHSSNFHQWAEQELINTTSFRSLVVGARDFFLLKKADLRANEYLKHIFGKEAS